MTTIMTLVGFELHKKRKVILGWTIAITAIMFLYLLLYPSIKELFLAKMDLLPKEMLSLVGIESLSDVNDYNRYFGMIFNIILIAISVFAVTFGSGLIEKEESNKTIEFLYSLKVNRFQIISSKMITSFISLVLIITMVFISALISGYACQDDSFEIIKIVKIVLITGFSSYFFWCLGIFLASLSSRINGGMVGSVVVVIMYMLGYLSSLLATKGKWLMYFSPFQLFGPNKAINGVNDMMFILYFILCIILIIAGIIKYCHRDMYE